MKKKKTKKSCRKIHNWIDMKDLHEVDVGAQLHHLTQKRDFHLWDYTPRHPELSSFLFQVKDMLKHSSLIKI